jgi:hypothetical protein
LFVFLDKIYGCIQECSYNAHSWIFISRFARFNTDGEAEMNDFWVEFTDSTTAGEITAGLKAVPAINPELEDDTWFFSARWGTSQRDLNNLKGRIETGSGRNSVSDIGLQADSDARRKQSEQAS